MFWGHIFSALSITESKEISKLISFLLSHVRCAIAGRAVDIDVMIGCLESGCTIYLSLRAIIYTVW